MMVFRFSRWMERDDPALLRWYNRFEGRRFPCAIVDSQEGSSVWVAGEPSMLPKARPGKFELDYDVIVEANGFGRILEEALLVTL